MMDNKMNRRGFFTTVAKIAGIAAIAPAALNAVFSSEANAQEKRRGSAPAAAGGGMPMVDPNDAVAKAVKYVEDFKKSAESKGNHCVTCGFYAKKEVKAGKEVGTCTIFAGKLVYANAWCASWNKKA
ncbi:high-potential iron-sulfur protein [Bdellovibrio svalbardensis]|uniref:High-potential iron-sulfur protein n=1 Tax=Bdellovibrio svalbardensis TaxID=2972972 RepID=A0ABT6DN81_9BACT|nr:high-potential iron-sulfur protein [Bdellovibrio svalbardensis]MDG0818248.1 high-potential iron-sulfur protein [Bdellovibrio svalbardensis]